MLKIVCFYLVVGQGAGGGFLLHVSQPNVHLFGLKPEKPVHAEKSQVGIEHTTHLNPDGVWLCGNARFTPLLYHQSIFNISAKKKR